MGALAAALDRTKKAEATATEANGARTQEGDNAALAEGGASAAEGAGGSVAGTTSTAGATG